MNILVIGNGFDLAHGLPTKYTDFLNWVVDEYEFYESLKSALKGLNIKLAVPDIKKKTKKTSNTHRINGHQEELLECINDNRWIEYFLYCQVDQNTNWIDFESEISKVIRSIEKNMQGNLDNKVTHLDNEFLSMKYVDGNCELKFSDLRNILLNDLNKLIRALELYLCGYVEIMKIKKKSPDIESLKIDNVISFNYTNIFSKLYKTTGRIEKNKSKSFDYIHGQASINNTIKSNNMVLGIDEYLSGDRMNRDVEFITFKKYYQRIYKGTGNQYKDWVDKIRNSWKVKEWINSKYFMQFPFFIYFRAFSRCYRQRYSKRFDIK